MSKPYEDSFVTLAVSHLNPYSAGSTLFIIDPKIFFGKNSTVLCPSFIVCCPWFIVHRLFPSSIVHRLFRTALSKTSFMLHYIRLARSLSGNEARGNPTGPKPAQAGSSFNDPCGHRVGNRPLSLFQNSASVSPNKPSGEPGGFRRP